MRYFAKNNTLHFSTTADEVSCHAEYLKTSLDVDGWIHSHDGFELYFNLYGGKSLIIGEEIHTLSRGSVALICPHDLHGHNYQGTLKTYERASVYFSAAYLQSITNGYLTDAFLQDMVKTQGHFFMLDEPHLMRALQIIEDIVNSFEKTSPLDKLRTATSLADILLLFIQNAVRDNGEASQIPPTAFLMHSIMTYINDNFADNLSIASLSQRFAISCSYLSHLFKEYCGNSVYDYVQHKRIALAKQLIVRNENASTVATKCGFTDYSCFLRAFKKRVGCSPNQYKKRLTNEEIPNP